MSKRFRPTWQKICPHEKGPFKRYLKLRKNRAMRRWARRDPANAPRKAPYWGWSN